MSLRVQILFLTLCVVAAGCHRNPIASYVGEWIWSGSSHPTNPNGDYLLKITEDGKWAMSDGDGKVIQSGSSQCTDDQISITATQANGKDVPVSERKPTNLELSEGGEYLKFQYLDGVFYFHKKV